MQVHAQVNLLWETVGIYINKYLFVSHLQSRIAHLINKSKLNIYQPIVSFVAIEKNFAMQMWKVISSASEFYPFK